MSRSSDGRLDIKLSTPGGPGAGTNPEQLFAAGYAACFESALRHIARNQKLPLKGAAVTASVSLNQGSGGFVLGVELEAEIEGLDQDTADILVAAAHKVCPYSNATRGNIDVKLSAKAL